MSEELGKRAVDCKGWRWMPGMRRLHPEMGASRVLVPSGPQGGCHVAKEQRLAAGFRVEKDGCLPDLTDPATLGCLLALVRDAWDDEGLAAVVASYDHKNGCQWRVIAVRHCTTAPPFDAGISASCLSTPGKRYSTEAEALVAALEAAE